MYKVGKLIPYLFVTAVALWYFDQPIIWDSQLYAECAINFYNGNASQASCYSHPTHLFIGFLSIAWGMGGVLGIKVAILILFLSATWAIIEILKILFPDDSQCMHTIKVLAIVSSPLFISSVAQAHADIGVMVGALLCISFLLRKEYEAATAIGLFMAFSKEAGIMLYTLFVIVFFLKEVIQTQSIRTNMKMALVLPIPIVCFIVYILYVKLGLGSAALFGNPGVSQAIDSLLYHNLSDKRYVYAFAGMLILQFQWILTGMIVLGSLVLWLPNKNKDELSRQKELRKNWVLFFFIALGMMYIATRYLPVHNPRYWLFFVPILSILFFISIHQIPSRRESIFIFLCLIAINLSSWNYSLDPISKAIYGSFKVHNKIMYPMAEVTHDPCCGIGRDQLMYSFQYLDVVRVRKAIDKTAQDLKTDYISLHQFVYLSSPLEIKIFNQKDPNIQLPEFISTHQLLEREGIEGKILLAEMPQMPDSTVQELLRKYESFKEIFIEEVGLKVFLIDTSK